MAACTGAAPLIQTPSHTESSQNPVIDQQTSTPSLSPIYTQTPVPETSTNTPLPSHTNTFQLPSTGTPTPVPPILPSPFRSNLLRPNITPQAYIEDTCEYLKLRWDPNNSSPGTVVMPVMFHSITGDQNDLAADGSQIHEKDLDAFILRARELGFETITTEQLVHFLERNEKIPPRSMILILDDRRPGVARVTFYPYLIKYNWTLTLAWIIGDTDQKPATYLKELPNETYMTLWQQMEAYYALGVFDIQAHGYIHNIVANEESTEEFLRHELIDSRLELQKHFYCKDQSTGEEIINCQTDQPLAYIWPGGGFAKRAVEIARQAGYHVGFTINPRGPVMFNWIPLAAEKDASSPSWLPEIPMDDPLLVLPRYWSKDALYRLDEVTAISDEAIAYAQKYREVELSYLNNVCQPSYPETQSP